MGWLRDSYEEKPVEKLNKAQDALNDAIETNDFDVIHEHRLNKDRLVQDFVGRFGRTPSQDPYSKRFY